jgi:hypothetical protein
LMKELYSRYCTIKTMLKVLSDRVAAGQTNLFVDCECKE